MVSARKIGLLSTLYFVQGLPFGFQAIALPVYLRTHGVSREAIGFLGALAAPWILKALWAPFVDRYFSAAFGRRKSWIVPMQAGLMATCAIASAVPADNTALLLVLVFLMNLFAATQDIAVDGLAVDLLSTEELGPGNAAQVVGYKIGMLTGGGLLVWASQWIGWRGLFLAMTALIGVALMIVLAYREPTATDDRLTKRRSVRDIALQLWRVVCLPGSRWLVVFVLTYKFGESMIDVMFKPFLVDADFAPDRIGLWVGTWGMAFSIAGSIAGGVLAVRRPIWNALALAATLRVLPLFGEWGLALGTPTAAGVILVTCAEHFFGGMLTTCTFAFMMARVDRTIGATHYTALAALEVLGKAPGSLLSGVVAGAVGYAWTFGIGTVLSVAFLAVLIPLRGSPTRAP